MAHTASISQLQNPDWALVNGTLVPYRDVRIHISAEALTRALSVFEGLKGYWDPNGQTFSIRSPRQHFERLRRSAALFHIPVAFDYSSFLDGLEKLAAELLVADRDLWFRATLYVTEGHWGQGTAADLVVTAFTQPMHDPDTMRLGVSTWRRPTDVSLPTRVKSSANYVVARLARIDARRLGFDDAVLLNPSGRVAEATGACIVVATNGRIVTPPASEGCLDSITVSVIEKVCADIGVPFDRRPIERSELLVADECAVAGTISELTPVEEIDGFGYAVDGLLSSVRREYLAVMRGVRHLPDCEMVPVARHRAVAAVAMGA